MPKCHKCPIHQDCVKMDLKVKNAQGKPEKACPLLWSVSVCNFLLSKEEGKEGYPQKIGENTH